VAAGGNVNISGYSVGCKVYPPPQAGGCVPYGSVTCEQIANDGNWVSTVVSGQNIYATGGEIKLGNVATVGQYYADSTIKYGAGCTAFIGELIDFDYWKQYLIGLSAKVAGLTATGTASFQYGTLTLTGTLAHHMEVFSVRGSDLCSANYINIVNFDSYATIFINVMGDNLNCGRCGFSQYNQQNVLFNFFEARTLTFQSVAWMGSVLAPYADIINPTGNMVGQVFANSWKSPGVTCMQQNWYPFQGCITSCYWHRSDALCTYSGDAWGQDTCSSSSSCPAFAALNNEFDYCLPLGIVVGCGQN